MSKPICSKKAPAPPVHKVGMYNIRYSVWNRAYEHPDAVAKSISDIYEDYEITCPHCKRSYISEGSDY